VAQFAEGQLVVVRQGQFHAYRMPTTGSGKPVSYRST
jgi:hypothetical protein